MKTTLLLLLFATCAMAATSDSSDFAGQRYVHRWSKNGQNEFTPPADRDLTRWREMVTIDVHEPVHDGEALATLANRVLANYQGHGKIVRTNSKPRTTKREAEHFIAAVLAGQGAVEAALARVVLVDGTGVVVVYSRRAYGNSAGAEIGNWLQANGASAESSLMAWDAIPSPAALQRLPQSR